MPDKASLRSFTRNGLEMAGYFGSIDGCAARFVPARAMSAVKSCGGSFFCVWNGGGLYFWKRVLAPAQAGKEETVHCIR